MSEAETKAEKSRDHAFYGELASWWPLISPLSDYQGEATFVADLIARRASPLERVLELGSGGGHCAHFIKHLAQMTLVDLSEGMLDVSRQLNPECRHVAGDMRTVRFEETFDAVFVHDAIEYMTTEDDLRAAFETAAAHLRSGGVALFLPDHLVETFEPSSDCGGVDGTDGRSVRFLEWTWDPDPDDTWVQTEYSFVLRDPQGVSHVHESHRTGLFARATWLRLLDECGFRAEIIPEELSPEEREAEDARAPRELLLAVRR